MINEERVQEMVDKWVSDRTYWGMFPTDEEKAARAEQFRNGAFYNMGPRP